MAFKYGSTTYPIVLDPDEGESLLAACDPALRKIIDYLSFMIGANLDGAVNIPIQATDGSTSQIEKAIAMVAPIDPDTIARAEQFTFPLFTACRTEVTYNQKTLNWTSDVSKVKLAYILPPLTASQEIRFRPLLNAVSQICNQALKTGHDPAYNNDERIVADNLITSAVLKSGAFGHYDFAGKATPPYFPSWVAELELTEQQNPHVVGLDDLEGTDFTVSQQSGDDVTTRITADAAIGATSIQVLSTSNFALLQGVRIAQGTVREEVVIVTAIPNGTHLTLQAPGLAFAHTLLQGDAVTLVPITIVSAKSEVG